MPGPVGKDPSTRTRRNKASSRQTLRAVSRMVRPRLPRRASGRWHPMVIKWWGELWSSPMADEYMRVDARVLLRLAMLEHDFWSADTPAGRLMVAGEIRLSQRDFGFTPMDRRRLEWTIERLDEQQDRGGRRRAAGQPAGVPQPSADLDPRRALSAAV